MKFAFPAHNGKKLSQISSTGIFILKIWKTHLTLWKKKPLNNLFINKISYSGGCDHWSLGGGAGQTSGSLVGSSNAWNDLRPGPTCRASWVSPPLKQFQKIK